MKLLTDSSQHPLKTSLLHTSNQSQAPFPAIQHIMETLSSIYLIYILVNIYIKISNVYLFEFTYLFPLFIGEKLYKTKEKKNKATRKAEWGKW